MITETLLRNGKVTDFVHIDLLQRIKQAYIALFGVAKNGLAGDIHDYKAVLEVRHSEMFRAPFNPALPELLPQMGAALDQNRTYDPNWGKLPWAPDTKLFLSRILCALSSFSDEHRGDIPYEFFPIELSRDYLERIELEYLTNGHKKVTVPEQYTIALKMTEGYPLAAAILAHSASRLVARNMDKRIDPRFNLSLQRRIELADCFAYFGPGVSSHKDPLGPTYHFWSMFTAMLAEKYSRESLAKKAVFDSLFYLGPDLMHLVREKLFGNKLVFGTHKNVDRTGYVLGNDLGGRLNRKMIHKGTLIDLPTPRLKYIPMQIEALARSLTRTDETYELENKIAVVTGANSGIGYETAQLLAKSGCTVVMVCRDKEKGELARKTIVSGSGNAKVDLVIADISSLSDVDSLAAKIAGTYDHLDILFNNAGAIPSKFERSPDGVDVSHAIYQGHWLLTNSLMPLLAKSQGKVINLSSSQHEGASLRYLHDPTETHTPFRGIEAYADSKLAINLMTSEMARRYASTGVGVYSVHPGWVATHLGNNGSKGLQTYASLAKVALLTPKAAAQDIIYLAVNGSHAQSGKYFFGRHEFRPSALSTDRNLASQLWENTLEFVAARGYSIDQRGHANV